MQNTQKNPNFFEGKTLLLIALFGLIYVGWNFYLQSKYPNYGKTSQVAAIESQNAVASAPVVAGDSSISTPETAIAVAPVAAKELEFSNENISFTITSEGMGIRNFTALDYTNKAGENIKIAESSNIGLFELRMFGDLKALTFDIQDLGNGHFRGVAVIGASEITRDLVYQHETHSFKHTLTVKNADDNIRKGFTLLIPEKIHEETNSSWLFPSYEFQDFYVNFSGDSDDVNFNKTEDNVSESFSNVSLVSVSSQYFVAAILDRSKIAPELKVSSNFAGKTALAELTYKPAQATGDLVFESMFYAGPKAIDRLTAVDKELGDAINFGFFGFISRPLLYIMKAFHGLVGNWGVAIILLTLLVRLVVLPFNVMSFRSMKKMQEIQPVIQKIRERFKDDPARLNSEMMRTMKEAGANPLGGCLPMLLQIPIFFALYKVIGSSIELYQSPFILWITDLSAYDKFYVLPVSMAILMYFQQKLTPSTMDPTQAKIMAFMPVVFSLFMLQLPSGLTLYMVVSTLFGIAQQYFLLRAPATKAVTKA